MKTINELDSTEIRPLARTLARELSADEIGLVSGAKTGPDPYDGDPEWPIGSSDAELR